MLMFFLFHTSGHGEEMTLTPTPEPSLNLIDYTSHVVKISNTTTAGLVVVRNYILFIPTSTHMTTIITFAATFFFHGTCSSLQ